MIRNIVRAEAHIGDFDQDRQIVLPISAPVVRHRERVAVDDDLITFEIPTGDYSRLVFAPTGVSSPVPLGFLPVGSTDRITVGVDWTIEGGEASVELSWFGPDGENLAQRAIRLGDRPVELSVDVPDVTTLGLALRLGGDGAARIGAVELRRANPRAWTAPLGRELVAMVQSNRFPSGSGIGLDRTGQASSEDGTVEVLGRRFRLEPTVAWAESELMDRSAQLHLHGFAFAQPMLDTVDGVGRIDAAHRLARLLADWRTHHPVRFHSSSHMPWNDMAVASRTMVILGCIRALRFDECPRIIEALARMAADHGHWLSDDRNHDPNSNHGLFSDLALHGVGMGLAGNRSADAWRSRAARRFASTLGRVVDLEEMTVREHSPAYVVALIALLDRAVLDGLPVKGLERTVAGLRDTVAWLTTPAGTLQPWGDTSPTDPGAPNGRSGVRHFARTGWSVHRLPGQSVAITGSYHSSAHKHADELAVTVDLADGPVLIDAGFPGYGYGSEDREYAVSAEAHNTVLVGGRSFRWREATPYGSSLFQPAAWGPWSALGGFNPLVGEARHERIVLSRPGLVLIADRLDSAPADSDTALFHLAADISVERTSRGLALRRNGRLLGWLVSRDGAGAQLDTAVMEPGPLRTRHFPTSRRSAHHVVVEVRSSTPVAFHALTLGPEPVGVETVWASGRPGAFDLILAFDDARLRITRLDRRLFLDRS